MGDSVNEKLDRLIEMGATSAAHISDLMRRVDDVEDATASNTASIGFVKRLGALLSGVAVTGAALREWLGR